MCSLFFTIILIWPQNEANLHQCLVFHVCFLTQFSSLTVSPHLSSPKSGKVSHFWFFLSNKIPAIAEVTQMSVLKVGPSHMERSWCHFFDIKKCTKEEKIWEWAGKVWRGNLCETFELNCIWLIIFKVFHLACDCECAAAGDVSVPVTDKT